MRHSLHFMSAALVLLMAACSGDDIGLEQEAAKYPLQLTATTVEAQTRAATSGMDAWSVGDEFAVRLDYSLSSQASISYAKTGKYKITDASTGAAEPASSDQTIYWQDTSSKTVYAWYPYSSTPRDTISLADQSNGNKDKDIMSATATGNYAAAVTLNFKHMLAKVEYTLVKGNGITDTELQNATVTILGEATAVCTEGSLTTTASKSNEEIKPYHDATTATGSALVMPQNMNGKPLLKVDINGDIFAYTPASDADGNLTQGTVHTYTITINADGISVTAVTGSTWSSGGSDKTITSN